MSYRVVFDRTSQADLRAIVRYITRKKSARIANQYTQAIIDHCEAFATFPYRGTARPDLRPGARSDGFRDRVTIIFHVAELEQVITILGIFYGGRSVEAFYSKRSRPR